MRTIAEVTSRLMVLALSVGANSCVSSGKGSLDGEWAGQSSGGIHAVLTIAGTEADVAFDCASGGFTLPSDSDIMRGITATGWYQSLTVGPPPAQVTYQLKSGLPGAATLSVIGLAGDPYSGDFELHFGAPPVTLLCP